MAAFPDRRNIARTASVLWSTAFRCADPQSAPAIETSGRAGSEQTTFAGAAIRVGIHGFPHGLLAAELSSARLGVPVRDVVRREPAARANRWRVAVVR